MDKELQQYLNERLQGQNCSASTAEFEFNVLALTSTAWRHLKTDSVVSNFPTCSRKRLFLVTSKTDSTIYYGICALEYVYVNSAENCCKVAVYIEKIDSSGELIPVKIQKTSLIRRLCQAYIHYVGCSEQFKRDALLALASFSLEVPNSVSTFQRSVYVFARPQPEYLFRNSSFGGDKHVLTDSELVVWWGKTLSFDAGAVSRHAYVPNEEHYHSLMQKFAGNFKWKWGLPYSGEALAVDCIPDFPDDIKGRLLKSLIGPASRRNKLAMETTKVKDLQVYMDAAAECRETRAGLFILGFSKEPLERLELSSDDSAAADDLLELVLEKLERLSFGSKDARSKAFEQIAALLQKAKGSLSFTSISFKVTPLPRPVLTENVVSIKGETLKRKEGPLANNVSHLIRKKAK